MKDFIAGKFKILLATEAAGMGCDISDVVWVVQFDYPSDINCLVQHLGRAARDPMIQGEGILLTLKSQAAIDKDVHGYVTTTSCCHWYLNKIFGNGDTNVEMQHCCDICANPDPTPNMGVKAIRK